MVVIPAAASAATARGMDRLKRGFLHYSMANERRRSRRRARPGSIGVNTNRKVSYLYLPQEGSRALDTASRGVETAIPNPFCAPTVLVNGVTISMRYHHK
jgi:hypothetical protein